MSTRRRWPGYLDIPEGQSGDWSILHKTYEANRDFTTATFRTAFIGGQANRTVRWDYPTRFHQLCEGEGVWMSDWPVEQAQCDVNLKRIKRGKVLVGGLGLGLCATILARRKAISHVTVVEKSPEVVKLVAEHLRVPRGKLRIVVADLNEWLQSRPSDEVYDWAFHDIWQADSLGCLLDTVLPLRQATVANGWVSSDVRVVCWNEDVMRGQILMGLQTRIHFSATPSDATKVVKLGLYEPPVEEMAEFRDNKWWDMYVPFWQWYLAAAPSINLALQGASVYSVVFGQQGWEEQWDRVGKTLGRWMEE